MEIKKHYCEVMDIVDKLFVTMFDSLNASCKKELEAIGRQYPFEPLKYLRKTLWLTFKKMFKCSRADFVGCFDIRENGGSRGFV
ncbi:aspartate--tRNA ligase 2, cytoplasmic-like isoform X5 [Syzygium oleosum]|uniref:aspartate--tRNA ligase 2, cytoplasmic-like isoform X5 n=1 Tax=Syzygium oleosum TaxID=219896 RepID=UPI0024B93B60|nr:aspartate--tRNA ligase 2, cytoplasmic-like isoform X5 [Syzygium oleosum]